jgi:lipopolysaccharide transport system permease protein
MDHQNIGITAETANHLQTVSRIEEDETSESPTTSDDFFVIIEPGRKSLGFNLIELWRYKELLYFLTWRDIKVRYKQTILGAIWAIMQPLLLMLIFTFVFARLGGIKSDNVPYPLFAFAALLPWTFFSNAVTTSGNSLIGNTNLITKVYFPRVIIPAANYHDDLLRSAAACRPPVASDIHCPDNNAGTRRRYADVCIER